MDSLLASTFLFRFAAPCRWHEGAWSAAGAGLTSAHRLPQFSELDGRKPRSPVSVGWNDRGLFVAVEVAGKKQAPWCRDTRIEDSDGLQVFLDTRPSPNVHRAGRFCHRFVAMPAGAGRTLNDPFIGILAIPRARESPREVDERTLKVVVARSNEGYRLDMFVPATALTGFDPEDHPRIGFAYLLVDRELGPQTWTIGPEFPFADDPSLWGALDLRRPEK